jgi:hypothetical protein
VKREWSGRGGEEGGRGQTEGGRRKGGGGMRQLFLRTTHREAKACMRAPRRNTLDPCVVHAVQKRGLKRWVYSPPY